VLDDFTPLLAVDAKWDSAKASLGNTLRPKEAQDAPVITLSPRDSRHEEYVVIMTDPDAPSRDNPKWSEFCHWIATGAAKRADDSGGGEDTHLIRPGSATLMMGLDDIMPYKPPGPPKDTGKHRYVIVVLAPENGTSKKLHPSKPSGRQHWGYETDGGETTRGVRDWAKENGLVPIGKRETPSLPPDETLIWKRKEKKVDDCLTDQSTFQAQISFSLSTRMPKQSKAKQRCVSPTTQGWPHTTPRGNPAISMRRDIFVDRGSVSGPGGDTRCVSKTVEFYIRATRNGQRQKRCDEVKQWPLLWLVIKA